MHEFLSRARFFFSLTLNLFADRHRCHCHCRHRRDKHSMFTVSENLFAFLSTLLVFPISLVCLGLFFHPCHLLEWKAYSLLIYVCMRVKSFHTPNMRFHYQDDMFCARFCVWASMCMYVRTRTRSCFKFARIYVVGLVFFRVYVSWCCVL